MKLVQNKETGILEVYEDSKKIGEIHMMGDYISDKVEENKQQQEE